MQRNASHAENLQPQEQMNQGVDSRPSVWKKIGNSFRKQRQGDNDTNTAPRRSWGQKHLPYTKVLTSFGGIIQSWRVKGLRSKSCVTAHTKASAQGVGVWNSSYAPESAVVELGEFEVGCMLGRGSFGQVYLGKRKNSRKCGVFKYNGHHELVAIKVVDKASMYHRGQVQHTLTEREVMLECGSHPFILGLHAAFQTPTQVCLVSEFCPGGELYHHLDTSQRFTEDTVRLFAAQALDALAYLHENKVAYRDLKCENVLLDASGNIRLADFGLSFVGASRFRGCRTVCGSVAYMAPEMVLSHRNHRSHRGVGRAHEYGFMVDWWGFGVFVYDMLVGQTPFQHANEMLTLRRIMSSERVTFPLHLELSCTVRHLIMALVAPNPQYRLGSRGAHQVYEHPFFSQIDWKRLRAKEYAPPIIIETSSKTNLPQRPTDALPYFDPEVTRVDIRLLLSKPNKLKQPGQSTDKVGKNDYDERVEDDRKDVREDCEERKSKVNGNEILDMVNLAFEDWDVNVTEAPISVTSMISTTVSNVDSNNIEVLPRSDSSHAVSA